MLNREAIEKEIERLSELANKLEFAKEMESIDDVRNSLASALGQVRAARTWLYKILKGMPTSE